MEEQLFEPLVEDVLQAGGELKHKKATPATIAETMHKWPQYVEPLAAQLVSI